MKKVLILLLILAAPLLQAQDGSIEFKGGKGKKISLDFNIKGLTDPDPVENRAIPIFMLVMGAGIVLIWMLAWKSEGGNQSWLHLLAEYLTAGILVAAAIGLLGQHGWGYKLSFVALGALAYTSLNSLAWSFSDKKRLPYCIPMILGLAGSVTSIILLLS
jgi:hypothetical protein